MSDDTQLEETVSQALQHLFPEADQANLLPQVRQRVRRRRNIRNGLAASVGVVVIALAFAVPIALTNTGQPETDYSCKATLTFRGHHYYPGGPTDPQSRNRIGLIPTSHMSRVGNATVPACNDTNDSHSKDTTTAVGHIDGVDPDLAVAELSSGEIYQRSGTESAADKRALQNLSEQQWVRWIVP